jgi:hypothetical protein
MQQRQPNDRSKGNEIARPCPPQWDIDYQCTIWVSSVSSVPLW